MSIRNLKTKEMIAGTAGWVGAQAPLFKSIPEIAGLYPHVVRVHEQAIAARQASEATAELQRLTEQLERVDTMHDLLLRACFYGLSAVGAHLRALPVPRTAEADRYDATLALLLPEGLSWVQRSYAEEAGNAATVVTMLTPELEALLKGVPILDDTLLGVVRRWGEAGLELARLERERSELEAAIGAQVNYRQARTEWIQIVQGVLSGLELSHAPKASINALRQPMLDLIRKAGERAAARASSGAAEEEGEPATGDGEAAAP